MSTNIGRGHFGDLWVENRDYSRGVSGLNFKYLWLRREVLYLWGGWNVDESQCLPLEANADTSLRTIKTQKQVNSSKSIAANQEQSKSTAARQKNNNEFLLYTTVPQHSPTNSFMNRHASQLSLSFKASSKNPQNILNILNIPNILNTVKPPTFPRVFFHAQKPTVGHLQRNGGPIKHRHLRRIRKFRHRILLVGRNIIGLPFVGLAWTQRNTHHNNNNNNKTTKKTSQPPTHTTNTTSQTCHQQFLYLSTW